MLGSSWALQLRSANITIFTNTLSTILITMPSAAAVCYLASSALCSALCCVVRLPSLMHQLRTAQMMFLSLSWHLFSPFILGVACYKARATLVVVIKTFHTLLWWKWVLRRPRFRWQDPFTQTQLCQDCKAIIRRSGLLFGSIGLFTKANEFYQYGIGPESG